jgi:hypothetical protein
MSIIYLQFLIGIAPYVTVEHICTGMRWWYERGMRQVNQHHYSPHTSLTSHYELVCALWYIVHVCCIVVACDGCNHLTSQPHVGHRMYRCCIGYVCVGLQDSTSVILPLHCMHACWISVSDSETYMVSSCIIYSSCSPRICVCWLTVSDLAFIIVALHMRMLDFSIRPRIYRCCRVLDCNIRPR